MAASGRYILVHLQKCGEKRAGHFTECIVDYFANKKDVLKTNVTVELINDNLIISDQSTARSQSVKLVHPSFCPIHNITSPELEEIPQDILERGINVGVSILVETSDNKILLSRRAAHLRTFPGIWVPPGGHIEENETLLEAGLREFEEEVGLHLETSQFVKSLELLALWESVYPAKLSAGLPKRHHVVTYLHGKLSSLTSHDLMHKVKMDANETDAVIFLSKDEIEVIDQLHEENIQDIIIPSHLPPTIKSVIFNEKNEQVISDISITPLFKRYEGPTDTGRVSSGTKMALHEWLKYWS